MITLFDRALQIKAKLHGSDCYLEILVAESYNSFIITSRDEGWVGWLVGYFMVYSILRNKGKPACYHKLLYSQYIVVTVHKY